MSRKPEFLNFFPSQQAAAALILAIMISISDTAKTVNLEKFDLKVLN